MDRTPVKKPDTSVDKTKSVNDAQEPPKKKKELKVDTKLKHRKKSPFNVAPG